MTLREPMTGQPLLSSRRGRLDCGWVCPTKCRAEGRQRRCEQGHLPRPGVRSAGRHRSARRSRLPPALEGPDSAAPETLDRCLERATHRSSQEPLPGRRQRSFARARIPNGAAPPRVSSTTPGHVCCAQARLRIRFAPVPEARARRRCAGRIGSCTDLRVPRRAPPSLDPARPAPARRFVHPWTTGRRLRRKRRRLVVLGRDRDVAPLRRDWIDHDIARHLGKNWDVVRTSPVTSRRRERWSRGSCVRLERDESRARSFQPWRQFALRIPFDRLPLERVGQLDPGSARGAAPHSALRQRTGQGRAQRPRRCRSPSRANEATPCTRRRGCGVAVRKLRADGLECAPRRYAGTKLPGVPTFRTPVAVSTAAGSATAHEGSFSSRFTK